MEILIIDFVLRYNVRNNNHTMNKVYYATIVKEMMIVNKKAYGLQCCNEFELLHMKEKLLTLLKEQFLKMQKIKFWYSLKTVFVI